MNSRILLINNTPLYIHTIFSFLSPEGHIGCFHIATMLNNAIMNMGVQISLQDSDFVSFRYIARSGVAGHMVDHVVERKLYF